MTSRLFFYIPTIEPQHTGGRGFPTILETVGRYLQSNHNYILHSHNPALYNPPATSYSSSVIPTYAFIIHNYKQNHVPQTHDSTANHSQSFYKPQPPRPTSRPALTAVYFYPLCSANVVSSSTEGLTAGKTRAGGRGASSFVLMRYKGEPAILCSHQ